MYAGHQPRLYLDVRSQPRQPFHVPSGEVHKHGLGHVVEVVPGGQDVRPDVPGYLVHAPPAEHPAVRAGGPLAEQPGNLVHGEVQLVLEGYGVVRHIDLAAEPLGLLQRFGTVPRDALVDRDGGDLHVPPLGEDVVDQQQRGEAVLAPGNGHGDPLGIFEVHLVPQFFLDPPLYIFLEVLGA